MSNEAEVSGAGDADQVPVLSLVHNERTDNLRKLFSALYKHEPEFFVRVPGRVNLIGEHVDYCGYGVCPMALQQHVLVAAAVARCPDHRLRLRLTNQDPRYEDYTCDIRTFKVVVDEAGPRWYQYFLCGVRGISELVGDELVGMDIAVSGDIPQGAGLSSSSALVCAAALTTAHLHQVSLTKQSIATLSAECEKYIGTQGGGMDQAIAFLASPGCAKLIEFSPLRCRDVSVPNGAVFVIAHSLATLNKAATADFNCRVIECRLASQIIAKKLGVAWRLVHKLGDLQQALDRDLSSMCKLVSKCLHQEPYSKDQVCRELEVSPDELDTVSLTPNTRHIHHFKLYQRALHVFQEALRVRQFEAQCEAAKVHEHDRNNDSEEALRALGSLMLASHNSLKDLYECSHPQLDRLVELSKGLAYGMRLTGAGWGGCAVALVSPDNVHTFIETLKEQFYRDQGVVEDEQLQTLVFATSPNAGASVYRARPDQNTNY